MSPDQQTAELKKYWSDIKEMTQQIKHVDDWTAKLSSGDFTESRPYLTRRKLKPTDGRFSYIELVYEHPEAVVSIVWGIELPLSGLIEILGTMRLHYAPAGGGTIIGFFEGNHFTGFESIYPGCVQHENNEYIVENEAGDKSVLKDLICKQVSLKLKK